MKFLSTLVAGCLIACSTSSAFAISSRNCNPVVPKTIKYRPSYQQCGGKAAVILSGKYLNAFSVVLKRVDHADRIGDQTCAAASCSPLKTQKIIRKEGLRTHCFGASGFSRIFNGYDPVMGYSPSFYAKWISIKTRNSGQLKDVEIYCLPKPYPRTPLN